MSTIILRPYQKDLIERVENAWDEGHTNVLMQCHTGGGKTVMLTDLVRRADVPTVIIAHRIELVSQLSLAVARARIPHTIISPRASIANIIQLHLTLGKKHYISPTAPVVVASVDTLVRRDLAWVKRVKLVVIDEAAHVLRGNKWGKAMEMFPNARGLLVTATPMRADRKGLGRCAQGIADILIEGPSMRELITDGYLSEYRIFAPPNKLDLTPVNITTSGEYSPDPLRKAVKKASITGNVVAHYLRHALDGLGITFAVSVEAAQELALAYESAGVPAMCVHAETGISERASIMRRFREGTIRQLVNVDILGEGVDVPAVSVVSLARPTASYALYMQQIGRALRPAEDKPHAIILDHVGNVTQHGLPDIPRAWTLESVGRKSRSAGGGIPLRTCLNANCVAVFERYRDRCPYCKHPIPAPSGRALPDQVEGDLQELQSSTRKELEKEIARIEAAPKVPRGVSSIVAASIIKRHHARQDALRQLQFVIADWAGFYHEKGESDSEIQRRFWLTFGADILTVQTYPAKDMLSMIEEIHRLDQTVKKNKLRKSEGQLTDAMIRKPKPKGERSTLPDGRGLNLNILPSGLKLWSVAFSFKNKKSNLSIGAYPEVTLAKAREIRNQIRKAIQNDIDPVPRFRKVKEPTQYNLTESAIKRAKPKDIEYRLWDQNGLHLSVQPTGAKYWRIKYKLNEKFTFRKLGNYPDMSLEQARKACAKYRRAHARACTA